MRKTVPIVVVGGAALLIASQFLSVNIGWRDPKTPLSKQVADKVEGATEAIKEGSEKIVQTIQDETGTQTSNSQNDYVGMPLADVLIDGDKYLLLIRDSANPDTTSRKEVAMYEVVRLARELPGDATGIKVRIWRTPAATAEAENALRALLVGADVKESQIDYRNQLVEQ